MMKSGMDERVFRLPYRLLALLWLVFIFQLPIQSIEGNYTLHWYGIFSYPGTYLFTYGVLAALISLGTIRSREKMARKSVFVIVIVLVVSVLDQLIQAQAGNPNFILGIMIALAGTVISLLLMWIGTGKI